MRKLYELSREEARHVHFGSKLISWRMSQEEALETYALGHPVRNDIMWLECTYDNNHTDPVFMGYLAVVPYPEYQFGYKLIPCEFAVANFTSQQRIAYDTVLENAYNYFTGSHLYETWKEVIHVQRLWKAFFDKTPVFADVSIIKENALRTNAFPLQIQAGLIYRIEIDGYDHSDNMPSVYVDVYDPNEPVLPRPEGAPPFSPTLLRLRPHQIKLATD